LSIFIVASVKYFINAESLFIAMPMLVWGKEKGINDNITIDFYLVTY